MKEYSHSIVLYFAWNLICMCQCKFDSVVVFFCFRVWLKSFVWFLRLSESGMPTKLSKVWSPTHSCIWGSFVASAFKKGAKSISITTVNVYFPIVFDIFIESYLFILNNITLKIVRPQTHVYLCVLLHVCGKESEKEKVCFLSPPSLSPLFLLLVLNGERCKQKNNNILTIFHECTNIIVWKRI